MAYKNYEDGEYLVDGERITVKNGAFELDGKTYCGFGYDDGETKNVAHQFLGAVSFPVSSLKSLWDFSQGKISLRKFFGVDYDYVIDHTSLKHSDIKRVDVPPAPEIS
jgi:hypothetical protein